MKTERNILLAFLLNLVFSIFEIIGGVFTGSVAIVSDAVHDIGDATSIGVSYFLEKKSKKQPDGTYTYGYARYSTVGSVITVIVLLIGSISVICNAVHRVFQPTEINDDGMILLAIVGACVNFGAAFLTRGGDSLNQKAVNLHMLEDVLGWIVVLIGAIVMKFTDLYIIDPLMSIGVAVFILIHAIKNLKESLDIFLEKMPSGIDMEEVNEHICQVEGVCDVHHVHVWSLDGYHHCATMHIVTDGDAREVKTHVREVLAHLGIGHVTIEIETEGELCREPCCHVDHHDHAARGHAHRHHH